MEVIWSSFTRRIPIDAPVAAIYQRWATRSGMESWFLRQSLYMDTAGQALSADTMVEKGYRYTWLWHGWPDETVEQGEILAANGRDTLSFTFGLTGAKTMACTVRIYEEMGQTICELQQQCIPEDDISKSYYHVGCSNGWTFYMTNLKSILEGGIDLRNKNVDLKNVINA